MLRIFKVLSALEGIVKLDLRFERALIIIGQFLCVTHIFNCAFWLTKEVSSTAEEMLDFLAGQGIYPDDENFTWNRYTLSGYFINTVFTTVGFGDVAGTNTSERGFLVVTMWVGALLFSIVMSEVEGFVSRRNQRMFARKYNVSTVQDFLKKESVPLALEVDILEWIDVSYTVETERLQQQSIIKRLPADLQDRLVLHLTKSLFEVLPVVSSIPDHERDTMIALLARGASFTLVRRNTLIATYEELHDGRLFVVVSGRVRMTSEGVSDVDESQRAKEPLLMRGDFFGSLDAFEHRASQEPSGVVFVAERSSELAVLHRDLYESVVGCLSHETQEFVKADASKACRTLFSCNGHSGTDAFAFLGSDHSSSTRSIVQTQQGQIGSVHWNPVLANQVNKSAAARPQLIKTLSLQSPSLARELSESRGTSPSAKIYERSNFMDLGSISGPTSEADHQIVSLPELKREQSFHRRSPPSVAMAVNEGKTPPAVGQSLSDPESGSSIWMGRPETSASRRSLVPANHPMAQGWLGPDGDDKNNLDDIRKEFAGGVAELKTVMQDLSRSQNAVVIEVRGLGQAVSEVKSEVSALLAHLNTNQETGHA